MRTERTKVVERQKWEYLQCALVLDSSAERSGEESGAEKGLNVLGDEGWELVGLVKAESDHPSPAGYHAICKRPKTAAVKPQARRL
jgi:hypothetical protein